MAKAKRDDRLKRPPAAAARTPGPEHQPASDEKLKIKAADLQGLKYFKSLRPLLNRLHEVGTKRDVAGNRELHMDQYCVLILLWLYSPILTSLRGLQQASELDKVRKRFGVGRASLGSLSESVSLFDPEPLKEIAAELSEQFPQPKQGRFDEIGKTITAVDGSVVDTVVRVARLAWLPKSGQKTNCGYRLHTQFEVFRGTVSRIDVTGSKPKGEADERAVLARTVEPDRCYVIDRGYAKFTLWNAIHQAQSSYVCRVRDNSAYEVVEQRELSDSDRAAGVLSDEIVEFGKSSKKDSRPDHITRLVIVSAPAHTSRGKSRKKGSSTGPDCDGKLRIATDMLDIPAELIAELYRLRWLIELFFRMFKQLLGCRHLLSTKQNGVAIQAYMAIIACLLILIHTGRSPTKRTFEMICFYMAGWASLEELERHIEKLKPQTA
ncbi:IS4 family transposase [Candidatus Laterigemmans baculatus]|uniref:IS4 family transposase n=1 Tax=Candidatus Laterigemmans baculatus TaxID=2770505 RepID=UPI0013DB4514|nr:IS4 family transposase [Candidatus Laterigemmans baculatus]